MMDERIHTQPASKGDTASIAAIYNEGIESRNATFETRLRTADDIEAWFRQDVLVQIAFFNQEPAGFAGVFPYRARSCYDGVGEFSVYVSSSWQGRGVGFAIMSALLERAEQNGYWKLLSRVFPENDPCRRLLGGLGFREVGTYKRHAKLDGHWRDVVIVERCLGFGTNASGVLALPVGVQEF